MPSHFNGKLSSLSFALVISAAFALLPAYAQTSQLITTTKIAESNTAGDSRVRAEMSYDEEMFPHPYADSFIKNLRLRITRGGETAHDGPLPLLSETKVRSVEGMEVRNVSGDDEPEVLVSLSADEESSKSEGPRTILFSYDPASRRYRESVPPSGANLKADGRLLTVRDVTKGDVRVRLSYDQDIFIESAPQLEIMRGGRTVLREKVQLGDGELIASVSGPEIRDLDADGEPEILLNVMSRGAYCCAHSSIYRFEPQRSAYSHLLREWSNYRNMPSVEDLNGDGAPEFVNANEEYSSNFCPFACSGAAPVRIWQYRAGRLSDVTRRHRARIRQDADHWLKIFNARGEDFHQSPVALAAYLADKHMLGEGAEGWRVVRRLYHPAKDSGRPSRAEYFAKLRRALRENGYLRGR